MPKNKTVAVALAVLAVWTAQTVPPQHQKIAIVGATLIDVSNYGHSTTDIADSVVLIDEGKIVAVGIRKRRSPSPPDRPASMPTGSFSFPASLMDSAPCAPTPSRMSTYMTGSRRFYVPTVLPNGGGDGELKIVRNASPGTSLVPGSANDRLFGTGRRLVR